MDLFMLLTTVTIVVAGIIFMEYKFAKMEQKDNEPFPVTRLLLYLQSLGANTIEYNHQKGLIRFFLDDELF